MRRERSKSDISMFENRLDKITLTSFPINKSDSSKSLDKLQGTAVAESMGIDDKQFTKSASANAKNNDVSWIWRWGYLPVKSAPASSGASGLQKSAKSSELLSQAESKDTAAFTSPRGPASEVRETADDQQEGISSPSAMSPAAGRSKRVKQPSCDEETSIVRSPPRLLPAMDESDSIASSAFVNTSFLERDGSLFASHDVDDLGLDLDYMAPGKTDRISVRDEYRIGLDDSSHKKDELPSSHKFSSLSRCGHLLTATANSSNGFPSNSRELLELLYAHRLNSADISSLENMSLDDDQNVVVIVDDYLLTFRIASILFAAVGLDSAMLQVDEQSIQRAVKQYQDSRIEDVVLPGWIGKRISRWTCREEDGQEGLPPTRRSTAEEHFEDPTIPSHHTANPPSPSALMSPGEKEFSTPLSSMKQQEVEEEEVFVVDGDGGGQSRDTLAYVTSSAKINALDFESWKNSALGWRESFADLCKYQHHLHSSSSSTTTTTTRSHDDLAFFVLAGATTTTTITITTSSSSKEHSHHYYHQKRRESWKTGDDNDDNDNDDDYFLRSHDEEDLLHPPPHHHTTTYNTTPYKGSQDVHAGGEEAMSETSTSDNVLVAARLGAVDSQQSVHLVLPVDFESAAPKHETAVALLSKGGERMSTILEEEMEGETDGDHLSLQDIALEDISPEPAGGDFYDSDTDSYMSLSLEDGETGKDDRSNNYNNNYNNYNNNNNVDERRPRYRRYRYRKVLVPSKEQLALLSLNDGENEISFEVDGCPPVLAQVHVWPENAKIVVADLEGVVIHNPKPATSNVWSSLLGASTPKTAIVEDTARLLHEVERRGYKILFFSQATNVGYSKDYLAKFALPGKLKLPSAPIFKSPDSLIQAFGASRTEVLKASALRGLRGLFPSYNNPYHAGFVSKAKDVVAFERNHFPGGRIFLVDDNLKIRNSTRTNTMTLKEFAEMSREIFPDQTGKHHFSFTSCKLRSPSDINDDS
jgi:hypothetical protein